jgi:hypothetical protein
MLTKAIKISMVLTLLHVASYSTGYLKASSTLSGFLDNVCSVGGTSACSAQCDDSRGSGSCTGVYKLTQSLGAFQNANGTGGTQELVSEVQFLCYTWGNCANGTKTYGALCSGTGACSLPGTSAQWCMKCTTLSTYRVEKFDKTLRASTEES